MGLREKIADLYMTERVTGRSCYDFTDKILTLIEPQWTKVEKIIDIPDEKGTYLVEFETGATMHYKLEDVLKFSGIIKRIYGPIPTPPKEGE